ncbi:MAG: FAD-dependent monooxygenase [Pseudomonadota bacterium]
MTPLILGGGPAGSAAAIHLARGGLRATILERTREPADALCGGFLSWRTLEGLRAIGVDPDTLNPRAVTRLRLFAGDRVVEARLPGAARGVSRATLDAVLIARAAALGAGVERGVTVRQLTGATLRLGDGAELRNDCILLATGKHELRGATRDVPEADDPVLGLRVHLPASRHIGDAIELHLFDGGYAGLVVQEDGRANLCMAVKRSRLQAAGDPMALLAVLAAAHPALAERLDRIDPAAKIDAIANVPYGWRTGTTVPGRYRLGDQAAVIPSLAGEGMGIAIASGVAAARAILSGASAATFQHDFARQAARPLAVAGLVRTLAERPATAGLLATLAHLPGAVGAVATLTRIKQSGVDDSP